MTFQKINLAGGQLEIAEIKAGIDNDRPTFIFLHDALGCIHTWRDFPKKTCLDLKVNGLIYSRLGHGNSTILSEQKPLHFFDKETTELLDLLAFFNIKNPVLIGSSDGGTLALKAAARIKTTAVVTYAAHYWVEQETFEGVELSKREPENSQLRKALEKYHGVKSNTLVDSWQNNWTSPEFKTWNIEKELELIECPTLIIQGKNDPYASDEHAVSMANKIKGRADCHLIENLGHFPFKENAEACLQLQNDFLRPLIS